MNKEFISIIGTAIGSACIGGGLVSGLVLGRPLSENTMLRSLNTAGTALVGVFTISLAVLEQVEPKLLATTVALFSNSFLYLVWDIWNSGALLGSGPEVWHIPQTILPNHLDNSPITGISKKAVAVMSLSAIGAGLISVSTAMMAAHTPAAFETNVTEVITPLSGHIGNDADAYIP